MSWRLSVGFGFLAVTLLCICYAFLGNPLVFDDAILSSADFVRYIGTDSWLLPRMWAYKSLLLQATLFSADIHGLRLGNLIVHFATAAALFLFIRQVLQDIDTNERRGVSVEVAAFVAAVAFALHPLAIFAQGYLVQRTILLATCFSLLSLAVFWRGLAGSRLALWASCPLFLLAIYAKEHAVMLPAAAALLLLLRWRSGLPRAVGLPEVAAVLLVQGFISLVVFWQVRAGMIEPLIDDVLFEESVLPKGSLYPLSALNQAGLFFKYMGLWLLPNPRWISIDIRQPFPLSLSSWSLWLGVSAFFAYILTGLALLWRGGVCGIIAICMLVPVVFFATEFSSLRLQEIFVLYRSYLWAPFVFLLVALVVRRLSRALAWILIPVVFAFLAALSFDRLTTLSYPFLVWDEAAKLYERNPETESVFGGYRIYYNLGNAWYKEGVLDLALDSYQKALLLRPNYGFAYHQRGIAYLDLQQWDKARLEFAKAVELMPENATSHVGLYRALRGLGLEAEAQQRLRVACELDSMQCENAAPPSEK